MKITILSDNIPGEGLGAEWGLSLHIDYGGRSILLDAGASGLFAENAEKLGIDISGVEYAVLSHAHYDHADGMEEFFRKNSSAVLFMRLCGENCYSVKEDKLTYIGIKKGLISSYADRLSYVVGIREIIPGMWLVPHKLGNLIEMGMKSQMFIEQADGRMTPDTFAHEQSLVFETEKGLVVLSPCSHTGADNIIAEIKEAIPGKQIIALIGGFHLHKSSEEEVREFSHRLRNTGIEHVVTGHCTGDAAFEILKAEFGDGIVKMHTGLTIDI